MLVGIERADRLAEHLADAVAAVRARGDVGADPVMARIEADRVVGRGEHHALDALFARGLEQIVAADDVGLQDLCPRGLRPNSRRNAGCRRRPRRSPRPARDRPDRPP